MCESLATNLQRLWPSNKVFVLSRNDSVDPAFAAGVREHSFRQTKQHLGRIMVDYEQCLGFSTLGSARFVLRRNGQSWEVVVMDHASIY
jgi:hypothetical protein